MADKASFMTLRLLTPAGVSAAVACDSVQLTLRDGADGRGGGRMGIQRDHAPAVLALGPGLVRASRAGAIVFLAMVGDGFASVKDNVITVITDSAEVRDPASDAV